MERSPRQIFNEWAEGLDWDYTVQESQLNIFNMPKEILKTTPKESIEEKRSFAPVLLTPAQLKSGIEPVISQIKEARLYRGLTITEASKIIGCSASMIAKDESAGKDGRDLGVAKMLKYSEAYQVQFVI